MGCGSAKADDPGESDTFDRKLSTTSVGSDVGRKPSRISLASEASTDQLKSHHERLRKLRDLDDKTKIPFIMVELRGFSHNDGYIEVCGKDEYGVYTALDEFLRSSLKCIPMDAGTLDDHTPLPFCDALYKWGDFHVQGSDGTNNMGLATMQLVEFMCRKMSWTLGVINGGNVGAHGEIREQQVIFKAPHPMNMNAHHVMIELRSAGMIEVCGSDRMAKDTLHDYFVKEMSAKAVPGHQAFSDRYYQCEDGVFLERGKSGENNLGLLTIKVCDAVVKVLPGWSLVTMNGGNYGESGCHREQQLVFRCDNHPLGDAGHFMVEMREAGFIELCGQDCNGIYDKLGQFLSKTWGCQESKTKEGNEAYYDKKYNWKPKDMMVASAEMTEFFHHCGWQMQVCSQGTVAVKGNAHSREQQILFRPGSSEEGVAEPHMFIELYTGEGSDALYEKPEVTQVLANQFIRIKEVGNCQESYKKLARFLCDYLAGDAEDTDTPDYKSFAIDVFLSRGISDNNLGCWTMRLCDFMVDCLGWSFVVCNVCNLGPQGQYREQQLVFRWDGERREMPVVKQEDIRVDECLFVGLDFPDYWTTPEVRSLKIPQATHSCTRHEIRAMQEIFDHTFKRVLTRDRVYEYQLGVNEEMPYRLEIVHMFRSEHVELYRRFMERRKQYTANASPCRAKTFDVGKLLNDRIGEGEALLAHGTNPSSAMSVLKSGFKLSNAGKSTGTMFGYGIYLAEAFSKSDEYARDDNGGTYPGLMALLVCRCFIGNPYVVQEAGDYIPTAKAQGCDCVLGDRETKVGTYREFIFFDERQVVPEYAVIYRREYDPQKVAEHMRQEAKGTTGKNWQVKLENGWRNIPPDVSFDLTTRQNAGEAQLDRKVGEEHYIFDFKAMTQTNVDSSKVRQIRQPMRR